MSSKGTLHFPDKLIVRFIEDDTGRPVPNIAITLILYARRKNDYYLGPGLSDLSGVITIDREWVRKSVEENINFFIMDYYSPMGQCYPHVDIKVMSPDDIYRAINAMQLYGPVAQKLGVAHSIRELKNASNYEYEPRTDRVMLDSPGASVREVVIKLRRHTT